MADPQSGISVDQMVYELGTRMIAMGFPANLLVRAMLSFAIGLMKSEVGAEATRRYIAEVALIVGEELQRDV